jgi:transcriptional regulator with XRE-family HTH domain
VTQQLTQPGVRLAFDKERATLEFGQQLAHALAANGMSRAQLARNLGKTRAYVTQVMRDGQNLTIKTMAELAGACGHELHIKLHQRVAEGGPIYSESGPDWSAIRVVSKQTMVYATCSREVQVLRQWTVPSSSPRRGRRPSAVPTIKALLPAPTHLWSQDGANEFTDLEPYAPLPAHEE